MIPKQTRIVGIPWYFRQDYARILEIMEDAHLLPATYDRWLKRAEEVEGNFRRQGHVVVRAIIDPSKFSIWCEANSLNVDANARTRWANEVAYSSIAKPN